MMMVGFSMLFSCMSTEEQSEKEVAMANDKPIVILKLDDLRDNSYEKFKLVADYVIEKDIKASFGINGKYLEGKDQEHPFIVHTKYWDSTGNIEIWHHGWDHSKASDRSWYEYKGRGMDDRAGYVELADNYERQYLDFEKTMDIVDEVLGITMHTFGSPYNQNDETFVEVINKFDDMKVVFFPRTPVNKQLELSIKTDMGRLNIENGGTGKADFNYFMENYNNYDKDMEYMVLQAHPGYFNEDALASFKEICDYLITEGYTFMTPYEYFMDKTGGVMPEAKEVLLPPSAEQLTLGTETIIENGDFAGSVDPWSVYLGGSANAEVTVVDEEANVKIIDPSVNAWDIQLMQNAIELKQGTKYRVVFNARSVSGERTIESNVIDNQNPKLAYSGKETFTLSDTMQNFAYDFTMYEAGTSDGRLRFRLGKFGGDVIIDSVAVYEYVKIVMQ